MNDGFELLDPSNAHAFLKSFPATSRREGNKLFDRGRVQDVVPETPGMEYRAVVDEGKLYKVVLQYDSIDGWSGHCGCEEGPACAHMVAAMRALLAEHSRAAVRNLSAGLVPARAKTALPEDLEGAGLARRLMAAERRSLTAKETSFIRKVHAVYSRCRKRQHITHWDFEEMGLPLGGNAWQALEIWPQVPSDEYEFWLYVANAAQGRIDIPEFMASITDLTVVQERLARWKHEREVEHWKQSLKNLSVSVPSQTLEPPPETDLQLVIGETAAVLQWRRGAKPEGFELMKPGQVQRLADEYGGGYVAFTAEAELLWNLFSQRMYLGATELRYTDPDATAILRRIFRLPTLGSRVVDLQGQPVLRAAEPLHWELDAPKSEQGDYRLSLVRADLSAPPPILCIIQGQPTLYLCADALFTGPPSHHSVLKPEKENRIPADAIESSAGLAFIQSLGLPLPERIREKVRIVPFKVAIHCRLEPIYPGCDREDCILTVSAETSDGHQQTWTGQSWVDTRYEMFRQAKRREEQLILYDRSALQSIPDLLAPLPLRGKSSNQRLAMRVSKRFPELFAAFLKTIPPSISVHLAGELASFSQTEIAGQLKLEVTEAEIDWFDLRVVLQVTDTTLNPEELKLLLNARGGYVRLLGRGWRRLQFDLTEEEDERLARLGLSPRDLTAEPQKLHALQLADDAAKRFLPEQQVAQIQRRASEIKTRVCPALPQGVTAELRPYQLEGFYFLAYLTANRFGGILADDMGLGKTLQALAWLLWLRGESSAQKPAPNGDDVRRQVSLLPSLVVCPKSVMDNWQAEASRFTPDLRVKIWSPSELASFQTRLGEAHLHVLNYSQLRLLGESLAPHRWLAVILDEGQYIKNPSSQTAQIARALQASHRLVLSGTPIENRLMDLWSLMAFAMPGILGSRAQFGRLYDTKGDPLARRRLSARVRPFLLRRTKAQVAKDLPERIEEDLYCEIEGEQKTLYRAELKRAQQILLRVKTQKELAQQQFHFLTSMLRLRQICCHPRLVKADSDAPSAKSEALLEQLEPLMDEGQKVLVFSQFVELLDLLRPALLERQWPLFWLTGETENRGELVRQFQAAEGPAIFLISLKAGGFGLNLTAASYVVLFDPWWNPAVENQAIDRTHRIGQTNKVIAYRLLIKNSIEEKIRALQKQKQAVAEDVLGEAKFAQSLSLQDLQFLFAD